VEVIGSEIRAEIGAVAVNRAELHKTESQKRLLPAHDVVACKDFFARLVDDARGHWRMFLIHAQGKVIQDAEANDKGQDHSLHPDWP
jgi:hypothetical protein